MAESRGEAKESGGSSRPDEVLRRQLYTTLCLLGFVMTVCVILPINSFLTLSPAVNLSVFAFGAVSLLLWLQARRGRQYRAILFLALLATIDVVYFANGGSYSSIPMYLFAPALYLVVFFAGRLRWLGLLLFMANGIGLFVLEYFHPELCVPFQSEADRLLDLITGFVLGNACCVVMLWVVLDGYDAERRRLSAAVADLSESEERHRVLFESAGDAIVIHDAEGRILAANAAAAQQYGRPSPELAGRHLAELAAPEDAQRTPDRLARLAREGALLYEAVHRRADGTTVPVEVNARCIAWHGEPVAMSICRDLTGHHRAEAALRMESLGRLAGGVAHDFNNMLTVIDGHAELALQRLDESGPLHDDLASIHGAAQRSAALTRQLLAFARRQTVLPQVIELNRAVSDALQMLRPLLGEDIELDWRPGSQIWPVRIDPSQLDQILTNLCLNARDAIADVGRLAIETGNCLFGGEHGPAPGLPAGDWVRLSVTDTGRGMDQATLLRVFEPFFSTKGVGQGTGLGLATVYGAVEQNGGTVTVTSQLGQGSTFTVYLPRFQGEEVTAAPVVAADAPRADAELILLVEDEPAVLRLARRQLASLGYTVLATEHAEQAVRLAEERPGQIQLLLTDVVMPGMNGHDLAQELRRSQPQMKVIYMSGYTSDVIGRRGVLGGEVHFLEKPFNQAELAAKVRAAMDGGGTG